MSFQIPYNSTGFYSPIINDYLKGDSYLHNLVNHFPELENFEKQINEKRKQKVDRELLFNILSKQNQGINSVGQDEVRVSVEPPPKGESGDSGEEETDSSDPEDSIKSNLPAPGIITLISAIFMSILYPRKRSNK